MKEKIKWFKKNWFDLLLRLSVLFFIGYSAFSLNPEINWVSRFIAVGFVLHWVSKLFPSE